MQLESTIKHISSVDICINTESCLLRRQNRDGCVSKGREREEAKGGMLSRWSAEMHGKVVQA